MQENFEIEAVARTDTGKGASRRLRHENLVPGIVYGGKKKPVMIATKQNKLMQHLEHEAFYSHILTVNIDGKTENVVLKDLQRHPAKELVLHVDLLRVAKTDVIKMHVPLHFINEATAPGVKAGGKASHTMSNIEVLCKVKDLPEFIEVDMGAMENDAVIHLSQLVMPKGVEVLALTHGDDHDAAVVSIHTPKGSSSSDEEAPAEADAE